jgi:hypothetical protein
VVHGTQCCCACSACWYLFWLLLLLLLLLLLGDCLLLLGGCLLLAAVQQGLLPRACRLHLLLLLPLLQPRRQLKSPRAALKLVHQRTEALLLRLLPLLLGLSHQHRRLVCCGVSCRRGWGRLAWLWLLLLLLLRRWRHLCCQCWLLGAHPARLLLPRSLGAEPGLWQALLLHQQPLPQALPQALLEALGEAALVAALVAVQGRGGAGRQ